MKKIEIADREIFRKYYTNPIINSEYQFSTLFIWQHVYGFEYEIWNDSLFIYGKQTNGNTQVYFPIGNSINWKETIKHIRSVFHSMNQQVNIRPLSEEMKNLLLENIDFDIEIGTKDSYSDYLYDYESLKNYYGRSYKKKRHELHRFCSKYNYKYETIVPENKYEALESLNRILNLDPTRDWNEYEAYRRLFNNYEELGLRGGIIRINGIIEAVSVGEEINSMILMHLRRCNKGFDGIYPTMLYFVLNNEFNDKEYSIINTQDDLGNENIRRTKLAYNPICVYKKYYIRGVEIE